MYSSCELEGGLFHTYDAYYPGKSALEQGVDAFKSGAALWMTLLSDAEIFKISKLALYTKQYFIDEVKTKWHLSIPDFMWLYVTNSAR